MRVYMQGTNTTIGAIGLSYKGYTISLSTIAVQHTLSDANDTFAEVLVYSKADHDDYLLQTRGDASTILQEAFVKIDEAERISAGVVNDMVTITVSRAVLRECRMAMAEAISARQNSDAEDESERQSDDLAASDYSAASDAMSEAIKAADLGSDPVSRRPCPKCGAPEDNVSIFVCGPINPSTVITEGDADAIYDLQDDTCGLSCDRCGHEFSVKEGDE